MKFKVFTGNEEKKEEEVYFKLVEGENIIYLVACDNAGHKINDGFVLSIYPGKGIYMFY